MQLLIATSRLARITSPRKRGEVGRRAQRGIRVRGKWPRAVAAVRSRADPSPQPSPRKRGEGVPSLSGLRVGPPFGDGPVGAGDDFEQMAVGILEIQASAAIEMVDLAASVAVEVSVESDAGAFDAGQR